MRFALLIVFPLMVAACSSTRNLAPIVDRSPRPESKPAPVAAVPAGTRQMDSHGYYTVKKGDTLYQIALDFGQNFRDLVVWNNLASANDIRVDQVLRVVPPTAAAGAAQPAGVPATPGIEVRPLGTPVASVPLPTQNKTTPRGDKQPYSETALAEMQKPEEAALAAAPGKPQEKPADKPSEPVAGSAEDTAVSWMWPVEGKVIGGFDDTRKGIDISGKLGQQVVAAASGKVMYAGSGIRGYGNLVIVKHTNNLLSAYAHNKTILVKEGQNVGKGEKIAEMGNSDADAVKLHFEIRQQGKPVDPSKFLPSQ